MAEIKGRSVERFLTNPPPNQPIILIFGPDRGRVALNAKTLLQSIAGPDPDPMNVVHLDAEGLESEPARIAEEADSVPMFGGEKVVVARLDDPKVLVKPIEALLEAPPTSARIVILAGDLKKNHPLRSRIEKAVTGASIACYAADRRDVATLLAESVKSHGLSIGREAQEEVLSMLGADHAMSQAEIEKLCLFARADGTITVDHVQAVLVDSAARAISDVGDAAFAGRREMALQASQRAVSEGSDPSLITQMMLRHGQTLEQIRLEMDRGTPLDRAVGAARPPIFFKRRPAIEQALTRWTAASLRRCVAHLDEELVQTRLEPLLKETRLQRQILRIASEASRRRR